jgi:pimeloyl-ACP methyl ester carboxylesterase
MVRTICICLALASLLCGGGGCLAQPHPNPAFDVTVPDAENALKTMQEAPKPLNRPLVVLGGFNDPGIAANHLRGEFKRLTGDSRVIGVSFMFCPDFDSCRRIAIEEIERAFPSDDPNWTTEVDVIGVSMGGLVARYAAAAPFPTAEPSTRAATGKAPLKRLRIARLFTISSPHRGATQASWIALSKMQLDMRVGSPFLIRLNGVESSEQSRDRYEVIPYTRLQDVVVGEANAAPYGQEPWWVDAQPLEDSHSCAILDARIIADVARRLRNEKPFTHGLPQPVPQT